MRPFVEEEALDLKPLLRSDGPCVISGVAKGRSKQAWGVWAYNYPDVTSPGCLADMRQIGGEH
jgi:hypothetical protein